MLDEMPLVVGELLPMSHVTREIDLFSGPEAGLMFLVHVPDLLMLDREQHKAARVFLQEPFGLLL